MTPRLRKLALTAHIAASVGWLGAVVVFLAIALVGATSQDAELVRAAYLTMEATGWFVLVPLAVASLLTGIVQSLGTPWGLFRHYWIVAKLLINVVATTVLLLYTQTLAHFADIAREPSFSGNDLGALQSPSAVLHASAAVILLVVATTLAVYKPRGRTPFGQRKQRRQQGPVALRPN